MNFELPLNIAELFSGRILDLYVEFLYLMYFKDSPSISFLKIFTILHVLWKKSAKFCCTLPWIQLYLSFFYCLRFLYERKTV